MCSKILKSLIIVCIGVWILGCNNSQEKIEVPTTKPAAVTKSETIIVTGEKRDSVVEYIVRTKTKLKNELEANLAKLKEDKDSGVVNLSKAEFDYIQKNLTDAIAYEQLKGDKDIRAFELSEAEFDYIQKNLTDAIAYEQKQIEAFRADLENVDLTVLTDDGKDISYGRTQWVRTQDIQEDKMVISDFWTGKPTIEIEIERNFPYYRGRARSLKMYRLDREGNRYFYAKYYYGKRDINLVYIDILNRDGTVRERISMNVSDKPYMIETSLGEDKWITWPGYTIFAEKRIKLVLVKIREISEIRKFLTEGGFDSIE